MTQTNQQPNKQSRHQWSEKYRLAHTDFPDGNARTEQTCNKCGLIKITAHASDGRNYWTEWRHPNSDLNFPADHTPPCNEGEGNVLVTEQRNK